MGNVDRANAKKIAAKHAAQPKPTAVSGPDDKHPAPPQVRPPPADSRFSRPFGALPRDLQSALGPYLGVDRKNPAVARFSKGTMQVDNDNPTEHLTLHLSSPRTSSHSPTEIWKLRTPGGATWVPLARDFAEIMLQLPEAGQLGNPIRLSGNRDGMLTFENGRLIASGKKGNEYAIVIGTKLFHGTRAANGVWKFVETTPR